MANPIQRAVDEVKTKIVAPVTQQRAKTTVAKRAYDAANSQLAGTPEEVIQGLFQRQQAAYDALDQYEQTSGGAYIRDYSSGILWRVTGVKPDGSPLTVVDEQGTKMLAGALAAEDRMNSYSDLFGSKFGPSGGGSAGSYLGSERDRVAEAERYYNDFIQRVGDIASLESVQSEGVKRFSDMFKQVGEYAANMKKAMAEGTATMASPRMGVRAGRGPNTDYTAIANSIKGTLPSSAPEMARIDPGAFSSGGGAPQVVSTATAPSPTAPPSQPLLEGGMSEVPPGGIPQQITTMGQPSAGITIRPGETNLGPGGMDPMERVRMILEEIRRRQAAEASAAPTAGAPTVTAAQPRRTPVPIPIGMENPAVQGPRR